jgi:hypothetical protein
MIEGWHNDDYLTLFDEQSIADLSSRYGVEAYLAGYQIVGLRGWDDFIIRDGRGMLYKVPTVPLSPQYLEPLGFAINPGCIQPDKRFEGKIKWYVHPIVFGGDPSSKENMAWLTLEQHIEAVKWWNQKYKDALKASPDCPTKGLSQ